MTKRGVTWAMVIGVMAVAALVAGHLVLPVAGSWQLNRVLHYAWLAVTGLAGAGGAAAFLWPRAKLRRRDQERRRARGRVVSVIVVVVLTFGLVALAEVRRDRVTRGYLARAEGDLGTIWTALGAYAAKHGGDEPKSLSDLVPEHLSADRLHYAFRAGPTEAPPGVGGGEGQEEPSYVLVPKPPLGEGEKEKSRERPFVVVQRPGEGWAPLVAALDGKGRVGVIGDGDAERILHPPARGGRGSGRRR